MTDDVAKKGKNGGSGYKKPPKHSQWKKGQSGKPKKEASIEAKLKKLAAKEIVVYENGIAVSMTQDEAMLVAVFMKAMKGDMAAVKFVTENLATDSQHVSKATELRITPGDLEVLENRVDWIGILEDAKAEVQGDDPEETSNEKEIDDENDAF